MARRPIALAVGVLLLVDVLRVWLPSIITIFGQAASTPAELMGGFALLWFVAGFVAVPLAQRAGAGRVAAGAAVVLGVARGALLFVHGGQPQLYTASVGLLAGLAWLAGSAMSGAPVIPGIPLGFAAAAMQQAALGTVDLTWRSTWWAWLPATVEVGLFWWYGLRRSPEAEPSGGWLAVGPAMLLAGMFALSPALAAVGVSYHNGEIARSAHTGAYLVTTAVAVGVFLLGALGSSRSLPVRAAAAVTLLAGAVLFGYSGSSVLVVAMLLGAWGLGVCLRLAADGRARSAGAHGAAAIGGMLVFAVAAVVYYASYDVGYPNQWVPAAVALLLVVLMLANRRTSVESAPFEVGRVSVGGWLLTTMVVLLTAMWSPPSVAGRADATELRLVAYNIRMGFGLDGTYDPAATARAIRRERPDVVVLSEVDRAWLLNGGHDDLQVLARMLRLRYYFAPAADQVWGDAILTNLPVRETATARLSAVGAPTGAQALGAVVEIGGHEVAVVSTHIQPPPDSPPLVQVREIAAFATRFGGDRPTIVAGDLNIEPGSESMRAFAEAGYADGFEAFRPVRTFPSDAPVKEIDHVLVRGGLATSDVVVGETTASDHAPVAVTLDLNMPT